MDSHIQTTPLVECPSYPDSVAWSEENLVAVASGSAVTIMNPALVSGPRGLVKLPPGRIFPIGVIKEEEICAPPVLPICLSRDTRPCVRSIAWSPMGFTPSYGCILAVCSTDGVVKLYSASCCEYSSEWVEVLDISQLLFDYLVSTNFDEISRSTSNLNQEPSNKTSGVKGDEDVHSTNSSCTEPVQGEKHGEVSSKKRKPSESQTKSGVPIVPVDVYESRIAMLSSLVVSWSSVLTSFPRSCSNFKYSLLAVGGKSGKISLWRFGQPGYYTIDGGGASVDGILVGLLQAHEEWVTALGWGMISLYPSEPVLLLGTGSSDGSMRLWIVDVNDLLTSTDVKFTSIQLLREVISVAQSPISTLALAIPIKYPELFVLAIGKGSGAIEAWVCHHSSWKFERIGVYNAHDQLVTGLACHFDGCRLYSCSQDSNINSWDLCIDVRKEVQEYTVKLNETRKLAHFSDPCFGVVLSPGNLKVAVVRSFDVNLLNPMYQARTQKAAVEFLWALDGPPLSYNSNSQIIMEWRSKILESLDYSLNLEGPLVLNDNLSALLVLWQNVPCIMENLLLDWLACNFIAEVSIPNLSFENIPTLILSSFSDISIRKIHILNIVCRRLILPEMYKEEPPKNGDFLDTIGERSPWHKLLVYSENIIRVRLVGFSLEAAIFETSQPSEAAPGVEVWSPVGLAQMRKWALINRNLVDDRISILLSKVDGSSKRERSPEYEDAVEICGFCSAPVPFESPHSASCGPSKASATCHKLIRCAVSMKLLSLSRPNWFCVCCNRWASHLLPGSFFSGTADQSSVYLHRPKPLCPFCGILLQRYVPNFLLSALPV